MEFARVGGLRRDSGVPYGEGRPARGDDEGVGGRSEV
jgi:hypothetical protein